jgi:hypothetical protein
MGHASELLHLKDVLAYARCSRLFIAAPALRASCEQISQAGRFPSPLYPTLSNCKTSGP